MNFSFCTKWRFVDVHPVRKETIFYAEIQLCHVSAVDRFLPRLLGIEP